MEKLPMPHRGALGRALRLCGLTVMALATSGCLVYDEDVSTDPRFKAFYGRCFELKAAAFVWRWGDTKKPELSIPGERVDDLLPATVDEYRQNPTDWFRLPPYDEKFGIGSIGPVEIVTVVPQGSRFTVSKILLNHHIENGPSLSPRGRLEKPVTGVDELGLLGLVDGGYDTSRLTYDANLVTPCPAVLPPGVKIGEKVAR
ncbi:MAG: hypothetical protein IT473_03370 [Lysobacter sp.]|nr:hypothetical protein [Lysobacter sp.]